jgi:hypothetical protein
LAYDGSEVDLISIGEESPMTYYELVNSQDRLFILKYENIYFYDTNLNIGSYSPVKLLDLDLNLIQDFEIEKNSYLGLYRIKGNNVVSVFKIQEDRKTTATVYSLPTATQGMIADARFIDKFYRSISFINFYDKVLFQADRSDTEQRDSILGFFDLDGIVRLINKIKASIGIFDT